MPVPNSRRRFVTTNELVALYPTIFPRSRLDFWARQKPVQGPPFKQPAGRRGRRVYDLDAAEAMLAAELPPSPSAPEPSSEPSNIKKPPEPARRNQVGKGTAAFIPKKRGPKSAKADGGES